MLLLCPAGTLQTMVQLIPLYQAMDDLPAIPAHRDNAQERLSTRHQPVIRLVLLQDEGDQSSCCQSLRHNLSALSWPACMLPSTEPAAALLEVAAAAPACVALLLLALACCMPSMACSRRYCPAVNCWRAMSTRLATGLGIVPQSWWSGELLASNVHQAGHRMGNSAAVVVVWRCGCSSSTCKQSYMPSENWGGLRLMLAKKDEYHFVKTKACWYGLANCARRLPPLHSTTCASALACMLAA